ncbi:11501_t:CDS:2 [Entrophospora sp. SA101]|nr:11501_t:CDS:2 [Entrophospora sp. SA101]
MTDTFTCNNCAEEKKTEELASTVPVYGEEPIKTCRELISIKYRKRVSVSEPNELGLKNGETYNFCSVCRKKVRDYNEAEDRDLEKKPFEV